METDTHEIIVIGAGACGLMAAWELIQTGKNVLILEARDRTGGRIHTIEDDKFELSVELGAEFVHGDLPITKSVLKKADVKLIKTGGEIWQKEDDKLSEQEDFIDGFDKLNKKLNSLTKDISVHDFIEQYLQDKKYEDVVFTLKNYVEGYYSADLKKASTLGLREELNNSSNKQYRPEGGYIRLIHYLCQQIESKGGKIVLNNPVQRIEWDKEPITIRTNTQNYHSKKILLTIPIGLLQSQMIQFYPDIPDKINASKKLGYGPSIKTIFQFEKAFWENEQLTQGKKLNKLGFIFSEAFIPTWWTQNPAKVCMMTGWSGGPHAEKLKGLSNEQIKDKGLESLSQIFNIDIIHLKQFVKGWHVAEWMEDKYSCGAYSYEVVDGKKAKDIIRTPLDKRIYFAGEGLIDGPDIGTVEGALQSGRETAYKIIASN
jgi:monoamine oxidase